MTQINLLPWRESLRRQKIIHFGIIAGIIAGFGVLVTILLHLYLSQVVNYQIRRNQFLETALANETKKLLSFNKNKQEKIELSNKIHFLISLHENNSQAISLLDSLVRLVPKEIILKKLIRDHQKIVIIGKATSYTQITELMEGLNKSALFKQSELIEISGQENRKDESREFQIKVEQKDLS